MMGQGLDWILAVAKGTADLPGAVGHVPSPPALVLPMLALGGLWLCLWRGWGRIGGVLPCAIAIAFWASSERPAVLIASDGALVGVMTGQGRALSRERGAGFVARTWLENDGSGVDQPMAATLWPAALQARVARIPFGEGEIIHLQGKTGARGWLRCGPQDIVVSNVPVALSGPCTVFDRDRLGATGAVAILKTEKGPQFHADLDVKWRRLWHAPVSDAPPPDQ
jgi:competence protein ComEC